MISPADIRYLREMCSDFSLEATILPDYSETLDGGSWAEYHRIPEGGTLLYDIRAWGNPLPRLNSIISWSRRFPPATI